MAAQILDGKLIAEEVRAEVQQRAQAFAQRAGRKAGLALVMVGDDAGSASFVSIKEKKANELGLLASVHRLPAYSAPLAVTTKLRELNADPAVDGVLLQLPLPAGLDGEDALRAIDPRKDTDGLHPFNIGLLSCGEPGPRPPTPLGVLRLLQHTGVSLPGKRAVVVGRSNLVGKPTAQLLLEHDCTVLCTHSQTRDIDQRIYESEIVVVAVGKPGFVRGDWIREGAIVIDVGLNRVAPKQMVGDVDFEGASQRASWITPVPGGVGPLTVAMLMRNTVEAAERTLPR